MQLRISTNVAAARVGYTVTKRQGNAVMRNRIKRRLREAVKVSLSEHLQGNADYVFIGRASAATIEFSQLQTEMLEAVKRLHKKAKLT